MHARSHPAHSQHAPARRARRSGPPWLLLGGVTVIGTGAILAAVGMLLAVWLWLPGESAPRVAAGVTVAGLPLGDETVEAASEMVMAHDFGAQQVTLTDDDRRWSLTMAELGVSVDRAATLAAIERAAPGTAVTPFYTIDLSLTQDALIALSDQVNIDAVPGDPPQMGRSIDIPAVLNRLYVDLSGELADGMLDLTMIISEPPAPEPVQTYTGETTVHVVEKGQELALIARMYGVDMSDIVAINDLANPDLLYIGQELTIPAAGLYSPDPAQVPPAPTNTGKSIVVHTGEQRIYAYENGQMVHSYLVSTGRDETPTVKGDFSIYVKYVADDMSGPDYFLPQVPYTMYFHQGYGIHGTYWHNSFGRPMSHGCVNLPTEQAQWFFEWAEVGTPVRVI